MYLCEINELNTKQSELKVTDWFYQDIGFVSNICCNWIVISVIHYKNIMQEIANDVVKSGSTHDALNEYIQIFEDFIEITKEVGEQYRSLCNLFVGEIDDWDQFVYQEGKTGKVIRDFSDYKFSLIASQLNTTPPGGSKLMDTVFTWCVDGSSRLSSRLIKEIGILIDDSRRCHFSYIANLANWKKCNENELRDIFERVRACDNSYSKKFGLLYDKMKQAYDILKKTNAVMENKSAFDSSSITEIKGMLNTLKILKKTTDVDLEVVPTVDPSIEDIESFTSDYMNQQVFMYFSSELRDFVYDITAGDAFLMAILQGGKIITTHYGTLTIPPEVPNEKHYEYVMLKKQLADIIADMADSEIETSTDSYELAKEIISKFKDGKHFSNDYQKYKDIYDTLYDSAGALEDGIGIGLDVSEIIVSMFADYLENEKIIASLASSAEEDSLLYLAVQQLQLEYKDSYLKGTVAFFDFASTTMASEIMKEGTKKLLSLAGNSAGGLYSLVNFGIQCAGEISGMTEHVGSKLEFCTLFNSLSEIEDTYEKNFANIVAGNKTEQDILNLQNSYEVLKRTYSKLYTLMGNSVGATGDISKQAYYNYVAREINNSSISRGINEVVSYDDFLDNKMFE